MTSFEEDDVFDQPSSPSGCLGWVLLALMAFVSVLAALL